MTGTTPAPPPVASVAQRLPMRRALVLAAALVVLPLCYEFYRVTLGFNFHTVVPGRIYRCSQPSAAELEQVIVDQGVRTIVNLRGTCDPFDWYLAESRTAHQHNVSQVDINFSAGRLPSVPELRQLILVLECAEYPIVMHCRRGADRTGMAAVIALLLTTDMPLDRARHQLGWRYGHIAIGRPAELDQFFDFYLDWLKAQGTCHTKATFRRWAMEEYRPGGFWSELALAEPVPTSVRAADATALQVRVRNNSIRPWQMSPQLNAGVHLGCLVFDEQDRQIDLVKSGLRDGEVLPGESMDFTVVVPPLRKAGRYRLQMDMMDEQQCWFYQVGSQPLEMELTVRE